MPEDVFPWVSIRLEHPLLGGCCYGRCPTPAEYRIDTSDLGLRERLLLEVPEFETHFYCPAHRDAFMDYGRQRRLAPG